MASSNIYINDYDEPSFCKQVELSARSESDEENKEKNILKQSRSKRKNMDVSSQPTKQKYQCNFCSFSSQSRVMFTNHIKLHGKETAYTCSTCKDTFKNAEELLLHNRTSHSEYIKCEKCGVVCSSSQSYRNHIKRHTIARPHVCGECGKAFSQNVHLVAHKRIHTGERPFGCHQCGLSFTQLSHLRSHSKTHTKERSHECDHCDRSFMQKSTLTAHLRVHTLEKPYVCDVCQAAFSIKKNLTRHKDIHDNVRRFTCDKCEASFNQVIDLRRHLASHDGIKAFSCNQCPSAFTRKANLIIHMHTHTGETPYRCDLCDSAFMKPTELKKHKQTHETSFSCQKCSLTLNSENEYKEHVIQHEQKVMASPEEVDVSAPENIREINNVHSPNRISTPTQQASEVAPQPLTYVQIVDSNMMNPISGSKITVENPCQNYISHDTTQNVIPSQVPTAIVSQSSMKTLRLARPAGNCPNVSAHFITVSDLNTLQTWCACETVSMDMAQNIQPHVMPLYEVFDSTVVSTSVGLS